MVAGKLVRLKARQSVCLGYSQYLTGFADNSSNFKHNASPSSLFLMVKKVVCRDDSLFSASFGRKDDGVIYVLYDIKQGEFCWIWDNEQDRFEIV